jgi:hypothetical protein
MLYYLQNYYNLEASRDQTLIGNFKHKLDNYFFKNNLSVEYITQCQSQIATGIDAHSALLAKIDIVASNELSHDNIDETKQEALPLKIPSLIARNSEKLYVITTLALLTSTLIICKPDILKALKTSSLNLKEILANSISSLKILLGLKENPSKLDCEILNENKGEMQIIGAELWSASGDITYESALEKIKSKPKEVKDLIKQARRQRIYEKPLGSEKTYLEIDMETSDFLTKSLHESSDLLNLALENKDEIEILAVLAHYLKLKELGSTFEKNVESPERWGQLFGRSVSGPLAKTVQDYLKPIPSESLERSKEIIDNIIEAILNRTTNLSETGAVYQRIGQRLVSIINLMLAGVALDIALLIGTTTPLLEKADFALNLFYALIPISCTIVGGIGIKKLWEKVKRYENTSLQTTIDHLVTLLTIAPPDKPLSDELYGKIIYWISKLEKSKTKCTLSIKERTQLNTLIYHLKSTALTSQQKATLLTHVSLV